MSSEPTNGVKLDKVTPQQGALLGYMQGESEARWCAGWLIDLHTALLGDKAYEWLVEEAGGWFTYTDEWHEGTLADLRKLADV